MATILDLTKIKAALKTAADGLADLDDLITNCQNAEQKKGMEAEMCDLKNEYLRVYEQRYAIPNIYAWDLDGDWNDPD